VGIHDNFFELGGHSLLAIQVAVRAQQVGLNVAPQLLFQYKSVAQLAEAVTSHEKKNQESTAERIPSPQATTASSVISSDDASRDRESVTPPIDEIGLPEDSEQGWLAPAHVFLSGATGYLGVYLLNEILEHSDAVVHCLVRAGTKKDGLKRIAEQLAWYFPDGESEELLTRVNPIVGDLGAARLGIAPDEYGELCELVEIVYHSAADVRHIGDTTQFNAVNVGGTKSVIALAQTGRKKILHHVSTLSVSGVIQRDPAMATFSERHFDIKQDLGESPYVKSKFLAEQAVREAMAQGSSCVIHRTGTLAADSNTGRFQRNIQENAVYRFMRAAINMGVAPYLPGVPLDLVPIDFVAKAIIALSLRRFSEGQTFHHTNPRPLGHYDLIRTLQAFGYPISLMDPREYASSLLSLNNEESYQAELVNVMPNFSVSRMQSLRGGAKLIRVDSSLTQRWLKRLGLECPPPTAAWLKLIIQHCIEVGYVRAPKYWSKIDQPPNLSFADVS
jgi:thioester reductase-like protein